MTDQPTRPGFFAWLKRHYLLSLSFAMLLFAGGVAILVDRIAVQRLRRQIDAIQARGEPVSAADLIASQRAIPDEDNLAIALFEAVKPYASPEVSEDQQNMLALVTQLQSLSQEQRPSLEQLEAVTWYLGLYPDTLDAIHNACKREFGVYRIRWTTPLLDTPLSELALLRRAAKLCAMDAMLAAHKNDSPRAAMRILDAFRCAHALDANRYLPVIASLTRSAVVFIASEQAISAINACGLDASSLTLIQREAEHWSNVRGLAEMVMVERATTIETWADLRSRPANPLDFGRYTPARRLADETFAIEAFTSLIAVLGSDLQSQDWTIVRHWRKSLDIPSGCALGLIYCRLRTSDRAQLRDDCRGTSTPDCMPIRALPN